MAECVAEGISKSTFHQHHLFFGFATCALATHASRPTIRHSICNATLLSARSADRSTRNMLAARPPFGPERTLGVLRSRLAIRAPKGVSSTAAGSGSPIGANFLPQLSSPFIHPSNLSQRPQPTTRTIGEAEASSESSIYQQVDNLFYSLDGPPFLTTKKLDVYGVELGFVACSPIVHRSRPFPGGPSETPAPLLPSPNRPRRRRRPSFSAVSATSALRSAANE